MASSGQLFFASRSIIRYHVWLTLILAPCLVAVGIGTNAPMAMNRASAPAPISLDAFKIITERNIFNPHRTPKSAKRSSEPIRRPTVEAFALVGTMSYEKGQFAFFDGTSSTFKKAVKPGEEVGGYTVADIAANKVRLKTGEQEIEFPLGMQMRRVDQGDWQLLAMKGSFTRPYRAPTTSSRSSNLKSRDSRSLDPSDREELDAELRDEGILPEDAPPLTDKMLRKLDKDSGDDVKPSKTDPEIRSLKKLDKLDRRNRRGM